MIITEETEFKDIRDAVEKDQKFVKQLRFARGLNEKENNFSQNTFDFIMTIILGTISTKSPYINMWNSKETAPWRQNFGNFLGTTMNRDIASEYTSRMGNHKIKDLRNQNFFANNGYTLINGYYKQDQYNNLLRTLDFLERPDLFQSNGGNKMPTQTQPTAPAKTNDPTVTEYIAKCIITSRKKNIIFTGAPGTGKTYSVEKYVNEQNSEQLDSICSYSSWYFKFVQFHGSYDYTDFVEGLRPIERGEQMVFVRMDGTFKALCREAAEAEKENGEETPIYYFVIDEINRAELSKVFGELMYCFEKRGSDHKVQTQYHNLPTYIKKEGVIEKLSKDDDIFKDGFYVPENVVIIGTMNDIDRNVETFDFALRRRFDWIPIKANDFMETSLGSMLDDEDISKDLAQRAINMNAVISGESGKRFGLNEDYHIGPAYFKDYDKNKSMDENLDDIWKRNIEPILREYIRGKNGVDKFINDCHKALMNDQCGDKDTNEPQTTAEDEE